MRIAFYAPMNSPNHPVPSGDRQIAQNFMTLLDHLGAEVHLVSELSTYDGIGNGERQQDIMSGAQHERARVLGVLTSQPPDLWFTYHNYYKAPDLLGPACTKHFNIPYVMAEATRAKKRLGGPWDQFAHAAEAACDQADLILSLKASDQEALEQWQPEHQRLETLPPFLTAIPEGLTQTNSHDGPLRLICIAMMREGQKERSYAYLADALNDLNEVDWQLTIVGDGPRRDAIEAMFPKGDDRIIWYGEADGEALDRLYRSHDVFVWPGIGEPLGMVYLEAQSYGLPALACNEDGPASINADPSLLARPDNPLDFADKIRKFAINRGLLLETHQMARDFVADHHSLQAASSGLEPMLTALLENTKVSAP